MAGSEVIETGKQLKMGFIYPSWPLGGVGRTAYMLTAANSPHLKCVALAIKSLHHYNGEWHRRCGLPVFAGCSSPQDPENYPGVVFMGSFQKACQQVIDQSDVIEFWGFGEEHECFPRLDWQNKPVIVTTHGSCKYTWELVQALGKYATDYRAVSEAATAAWGDKRDEVMVIYNGVDLNRIAPLKPREETRREWGIRPDQIAVGYIGRLAPDKNPTALAEAVEILGEPYVAVYVGGGYQEDKVKQEARQRLGERAIFIPYQEHIGDAFAAIDCMVMASPSEGHCQAVNEAWAAEVPIVSTRVGAIPELEERFGHKLVFPIPINPSADVIASVVKQAVQATPARFEMIRRARIMVHENFSQAHMVQNYVRSVHTAYREQQKRLKKQAAEVESNWIKVKPKETFSLSIAASKPAYFAESLAAAIKVFPDYKDLAVAMSPKMPAELFDLVRRTPRATILPGSDTTAGAGEAILSALDACTGDWIVNVDDDDLWLTVDRDLILKASHDVALISGGAIYQNYYADEQRIRQRQLFGKDVSACEELCGELNDDTATMPGSFRVTRRAAWDKVKSVVPRMYYYNDYNMLLCMLYCGYRSLFDVTKLWGVVRRFPRPKSDDHIVPWPKHYRAMMQRLEAKLGPRTK